MAESPHWSRGRPFAFTPDLQRLAWFLAERCLNDPSRRTLLSVLYEAFSIWTKAVGITRAQQRITFRRNVEFQGYVIKHTNQGDAVLGLVLRTNTGRAF